MMKQDPILPSIHISVVKVPPKQMLPSLREYQSDNIIKGALIALLLYGFFIFVVLWWMNVPIQQNPLSSTIEVTFESPIALPIPAEVPALSEDTSNENKIPSLEPLDTSELLPKTDLSDILPIVKPQTSQQQKKKFPSKASINPEKSVSVGQVSSINNNQKAQQETNTSIQATKPAHKTLSIAQRCTALTKNYPMAARRRHEEGIVHINYQVLPDGKIQQVEVIESSGFSDLDHAAEQAVQSMKCQTAPEQSVIKTSISVNFSLNKNN